MGTVVSHAEFITRRALKQGTVTRTFTVSNYSREVEARFLEMRAEVCMLELQLHTHWDYLVREKAAIRIGELRMELSQLVTKK